MREVPSDMPCCSHPGQASPRDVADLHQPLSWGKAPGAECTAATKNSLNDRSRRSDTQRANSCATVNNLAHGNGCPRSCR